MRFVPLCLVIVSATAACGGDPEVEPASSEASSGGGTSGGGGSGPLSGTIDSYPFVVAYSRASFQQTGNLWITLRNDPVDCGSEPSPGDGRRLEVDITLPPATQGPGNYSFAPAFTL